MEAAARVASGLSRFSMDKDLETKAKDTMFGFQDEKSPERKSMMLDDMFDGFGEDTVTDTPQTKEEEKPWENPRLPQWKRDLLLRKHEQQKAKQEAQSNNLEEQYAHLPKWKRDLMIRKLKEASDV